MALCESEATASEEWVLILVLLICPSLTCQRHATYYSLNTEVCVPACCICFNQQALIIHLQEITTLLPFSGISLDILPDSSDLGADLSDYIHHRVSSSTQVAANVTTPTGSAPDQLLLSKFSSHLSTRSHGSILYLQLTLDLFHKGHLALKGGNYLVVPVSLSEVRYVDFKLPCLIL